jgi:hypothetical protein
VPSIRFRLDHPTPEALNAKVRAEFGENARIVSATEVRLGGVGGFFARRFVEVEVELLPDSHAVASIVADVLASPRASLGATVRPTGAVGIEALLEAADRAEGHVEAPVEALIPPAAASISTQSDRFERVLQDLNSYAARPAPAPVITHELIPSPYDQAGGLVLFLGLGTDSDVAARSLARTVRHAEFHRGGRIIDEDGLRVDDRRSAASARARGVTNNSVAFVAWGLGVGLSEIAMSVERIRAVAADQIWVVVDAARKPEDTAAWVAAIRRAFTVTALAVVSSVETATPESVGALGLPIGWSETVG